MKKLLIALFLLLPAFAFAGSTAVIGAATAVDGSFSMIYTGDNPTPEFSLGIGHNWTIYWGDGTSSEIVGPVYNQEYAHTYASSGEWQIRIMPGGGNLFHARFYKTTYTFNIANIPSGQTGYFYLKGAGVSGDLADLPNGLDTTLNLSSSSVEGDIADLPSGLDGWLYLNDTNVSAYTAESWPCNTDNNKVVDFDDLSLSETEVDNIICHLVDHGATGGTLDLTGNAAPSATGLACETTLEDVGMGWTVTVHGE